jgi:hypothetical protein
MNEKVTASENPAAAASFRTVRSRSSRESGAAGGRLKAGNVVGSRS